MDLQQFLAAPLDDIRSFAPATLMWIVEGTRRSAALAGIDLASEDFPRWSVLELIRCVKVIFSHGVRHVFTPLFSPSHFAEVTPQYRERIEYWMKMFANDPVIADPLRRSGWRLRLIGANKVPALKELEQQLLAMGPEEGGHTLWLMVIPETDALWDDTLAAMARSGASTRKELIRACYGEDIPPATMLISFGKPVISPDQLPPLLVGKMDCYWTQRPGYRMTEREFREILFDANFVRRTWREDKTGRHEQALDHRKAWEQGPVLGLGARVGPFWYPLTAGVSCSADGPSYAGVMD